MRSRRVGASVVVAIVMAALIGTVADLRAREDDPLGAALAKTGLKFNAMKGQSLTWEVPFDGKDGKSFIVYLTYNDDARKFALIFSTVVDRPDNYQFSRDILVEAMKISNDYPGIKFCLDFKHGDIDVQSEVLMTTVTPDVLKEYLHLVASLADQKRQALNDLAR